MEESLPKQLPVTISYDRIAAFCRRHHIRRMALFGSILRADFGPESDVDVLVEFAPDHVPGLAFFAMQAELSQILGRPVDLNTPRFISPYFRHQVQAEAQVVYEQTYSVADCQSGLAGLDSRLGVDCPPVSTQ